MVDLAILLISQKKNVAKSAYVSFFNREVSGKTPSSVGNDNLKLVVMA